VDLVRNMVGITELDLSDRVGNYLGELIEDLPHNCFFNKVLCGAGGTHLALTNSENYVVLCPTTDLIKSKENGSKLPYDTLFVYGRMRHDEILDYINYTGKKGKVGKIMCTYHSLQKLLDCFDQSDYVEKDYRLLVDEAHMLTEGDDKYFMHNEISYVLGNYKRFKSHCFMTATPFPRECFPEQIANIDLVIAKWNPSNIEVAKVRSQHIKNNFNDYVLKIAIDHINKVKDGNAYFFYNSVEEIVKVCKKLIKSGYCTVEDIRIVCSDSNKDFLKKSLGKKAEIKNVYDSPHKINFLTSKAFDGTDIWDKDGVTYVCADGKKKHTRVEIHTKLAQIVNRIRDSKYKDTVNLLYCKSYIGCGMDKESFLKNAERELKKAELVVSTYYSNYRDFSEEFSKEEAEMMLKPHKASLDVNEYITVDFNTGRYIPNPNYIKKAIALWESANVTYSVIKHQDNINSVVSRSPLIDIMDESNDIEHFTLPSGLEKIRVLGKKAQFTEVCKDFIDVLKSKPYNMNNLEVVFNYDDLFRRFYKLLEDGELSVADLDGIFKTNRYVKKRLDTFLSGYDSVENTIYNLTDRDLSLYFTIGERYSKSEIKLKLKNLYIDKGIRKTPVATDLDNWYEIKSFYKKTCGHGFEIIGLINKD
jgi:hypothetical protein